MYGAYGTTTTAHGYSTIPQDPLQFAYSRNRNTEDAILTVLHAILKHLEKSKAYARLLFLDFSSAFNTTQPHLLLRKLMDMDPVIIRWLCSFLTDSPQCVMIKPATEMSAEVRTNTGPPQGCVLSPALFTLYTSDCRCTSNDTFQVKFSDDTSLTERNLLAGVGTTTYFSMFQRQRR